MEENNEKTTSKSKPVSLFHVENSETVEEIKVPLKRIVLLDDVSLHLISIKQRLKGYYNIYTAQDTETLFEIMKNFLPDLILLDINMPDIDGYEVLRQLKSNPRYADIPVIFLTGKADRKSAIQGIALGAVDFVTKPFETNVLIESIENQLDIKKRAKIVPVLLAVDDSPAILQSINNIFKDVYTVYTLPQPEFINEILKRVVPDLFLLDFQMPNLTGFDLVPIIRKIPEHKDTPIVFLTSEATKDNIMIAVHHLGAAGFITKPVEDAVLREKVAEHLRGFLIRRRIRIFNKGT